ncbi:MAG: methionyl-tRNA formyltransferase [Phycisphaerae bacterium]|nr:methionyl-tRNA formyltransferase [Phycisphaerae bacterium]OUX00155.1 MAG: hypothetical protein CBD91_07270 [Phycisphaeraceae bacterium TMED231]
MTDDARRRIAFLGSGAFGVPTLEALGRRFEVPLVISQPDRPAGRGRQETPTPISARILEDVTGGGFAGTELIRTENANEATVVERLDRHHIDAMVVIAFGQKLGPGLLDGRFAVNLHASLLPRWRGAAPINRSMMAGDAETGVSVISLASRMDAGEVHATRATAIDPRETAGELHDRLAVLGVDAVLEVLDRFAAGKVESDVQDEAAVTAASKLSKAEATVDFDRPADRVRGRIHGLVPWPGCQVEAIEPDGTSHRLRIHRVEARVENLDAVPGTLFEDGTVACRIGGVRLLEVQIPGGRAMAWDDLRRGRSFPRGTRLKPLGGDGDR